MQCCWMLTNVMMMVMMMNDEGNINEALNSLGPLLCRQKRRLEQSKMTRPSDNDDDDGCNYDYDNWMMMSMIKSMMKR